LIDDSVVCFVAVSSCDEYFENIILLYYKNTSISYYNFIPCVAITLYIMMLSYYIDSILKKKFYV